MLRKNYWKERQQLYLKVFQDSLPLLQKRSIKRVQEYENEDDISRDLAFSIEDVVFSAEYKNRELGLPTFQAYAQPNSKDKAKVKREDKCPDFMWTYVDYTNRLRRDYHVECKRLKEDTTHHCREYVLNGLIRFVTKEWSYGFNCESGLMIGYVEGVTISECLKKIDSYLKNNKIPPLITISSQKNNEQLKHLLVRPNIPFTPFELFHYLVVLE